MRYAKKITPAEQLGIFRVLLVDENFGSIHTVTSRLRSLGCSVTTSRDISDAINKIRSNAFDLIVCEKEPKKSSPIFDLSANLAHIPLIIVTSGDPAHKAEQGPTGALGAVPRFFKADSILELISSYRTEVMSKTGSKTK